MMNKKTVRIQVEGYKPVDGDLKPGQTLQNLSRNSEIPVNILKRLLENQGVEVSKRNAVTGNFDSNHPISVNMSDVSADQKEEDALNLVTLKNGTQMVKSIASVINFSLKNLMETNPIAFYELTAKCKDDNHKLFGRTGEILSELGLVDNDGSSIRDEIRNVVLSAAKYEGFIVTLSSPFDRPELIAKVEKTKITQNISTQELKIYYEKVKNIINFIFDTVKNTEGANMYQRNQGVNPFYSQIAANGAMALEMYYSSPSKLWTPLGYLEFSGGSSSSGGADKTMMRSLTERLGLVTLIPVKHNEMGTFGPIFRITKDLNGNDLPEVIISRPHEMIEYKEAKKIWEEVRPEGLR